MKLINDLRQKLESIGATLDEQAEQFVVCDSPSGYVWRANGGTSLTIQYKNNGGQSWLAQALRDEMPNLKMGLEKVTDEKELAEHRWNLGDDSWGAPADAPNRIEWPHDTVDKMPGLRKLVVQHPQETRP
jgi:hypothetical protein